MAKMPKEVMNVFNDPGSAKVLATAGSTLEINAVPKGSLRAVSEDVIAFADIFGDKTNKDLKQLPIVFNQMPTIQITASRKL